MAVVGAVALQLVPLSASDAASGTASRPTSRPTPWPISRAAATADGSVTQVWSARTHGALRLFGSSSMSCPALEVHCLRASAGQAAMAAKWYDNDAYAMQWVDRDATSSTVNSSSTQVRVPHGATVLKAILVWGGRTGGALDAAHVQFRAPGGDYQRLTSDSTVIRGAGYQSSVDVTDEVAAAGNGAYWGADVSSTPGKGGYAGWALAVAYRSAGEPMRDLTMAVGLDHVARQTAASVHVNGLRTPSTGAIPAAVGLVAWDGDRGVTGDRVKLSGRTLFDRAHRRTNLASSSVFAPSTAARPRAFRADTMGVDAATIDATGVIRNSAKGAILRATTRADDFYLGLVTSQVDLTAPAARVATTTPAAPALPVRHASVVQAQTPDPASTDVGVTLSGPALAAPGDVVDYTIHLTNAGPAATDGLAFILSAPVTGTSYNLAQTGVTCDGIWHCTVTTPLAAGGSLDVTLHLHTNPNSVDGDEVLPSVTASTTSTDPDSTNNADDATTTLSTESTLTLTNRVTSGAVLPGGRVTYQVTVKNTGPAPATNATIVAASPAGATPVSATGSSGAHCGTYAGKKYCSWTTLPVGQSRTMTYQVDVTSLAHAGAVLQMVAKAAADNSTAEVTAYAEKVVTDTVTRPTDVAVTMTVTEMKAGQQALWTTAVTNHGPYRAHTVRLTVVPPEGMKVVPLSSASPRTSTTSNKVTFSLGDIEVGQTKSVKVNFRVPVIGSRTMAFGANTAHTDPDAKASNDAVSATHRISGHMVTFTSSTSSSSSSSSSTTPVVQTTNTSSSTSSTSSPSNSTKSLADTGGPQRQTLLLGVVLLGLGVLTTGGARERPHAPRHRGRPVRW